MSRPRAAVIYEVGIEAYKSTLPDDEPLIRAIACMIAEATKKQPRKQPAKSKAPFPPADFFEMFKDSDYFALDTIQSSMYGRAGKMLSEIKDVTLEDVELVIEWVEGGGLEWWSVKPAAKHIVNNFPTWLAQAKAAGAKGPDIGKLVR
jgi:hypothetical protein